MDEVTGFMLQQMQKIEELDEEQVLAELAGETLQEFIYEVTTYNRKKRQAETRVKLSWTGTKECARGRGNIILSEPIVTDLEDAIRIVVRATDVKRNFCVFGGCHQPRKMKVGDKYNSDGEMIEFHYEDDPYCFQKGLSKAQRNALQLCIPAEFMAKTIKKFAIQAGKGHLLGAGKSTQQGRHESGKRPPTKPQSKPAADWEQYKPEDIPDYPSLEKIIWDLTKLQPAQMYKELGVSSKMQMTIPAFQAFLSLKAILAGPPENTDSTNQS